VSEREPDEDVEIDIGRWLRRVLRRWYLVLATVVLAVLVASLGGAAGKQTYSARALIYLGQPFTPNLQPIGTSLSANPVYPKVYGTTDAVLDQVARISGLTRSQLKGGLSIAPVAGAINSTTRTTPLVNVTVQGPWKDRIGKAANAEAAAITAKANGYQRAQRSILVPLVQQEKASLDNALERQKRAEANLRNIDKLKGLSDIERFIATQTAITTLNGITQFIGQIEDTYSTNAQVLAALNDQISAASVVTPARVSRTTAASKGANYGVAIILGLVLGVLIAIASYAVIPERRRT
jgi:hypothetical protein